MPKGRTMKLVTVHFPEWMIEAMEEARKKMGLYTRSDFIRYSVRCMLMEVLGDASPQR